MIPIGIALILMIAAACGSGESTSSEKPAEIPSATSQAPPAESKSDNDLALARVLVMDMNGTPLPNMLPIASTQPNAFNKPLVTGQPTGDDGRGYMSIPSDRWLYVRAWDPTNRMFANNYFDVLPGKTETTDVMEIVMLPGASLSAVVVDGSGAAIGDSAVGMMMSHPTRGPWWPAESRTDEKGKIVFESVPAGKYQITLETPAGQQIELPEVALPPGGSADLGPVALQ
jgi:hypothetical protein